MADYIIDTFSRGGIDFAPDTVLAEVLQNVRTILATRRGSVPFDRGFGISWDMIDAPLPVAKARFLAEAAEAVAKWEPRAKVLGVDFGTDAATGAATDGVLRPRVRVLVDDSLAEKTPKAEADADGSDIAELAVSAARDGSGTGAADARLAALAYRLAAAEARLDSLHELEITDYTEIWEGA